MGSAAGFCVVIGGREPLPIMAGLAGVEVCSSDAAAAIAVMSNSGITHKGGTAFNP